MEERGESGFLFGLAAPPVRCVQCGAELPREETMGIARQSVCGDCLAAFLGRESTLQDHSGGFLTEREPEFLRWLFEGGVFLSEPDKLRWLRLGWEDWRKFHVREAEEARREFIRASPGEWEDYLKGL